MLGNTLTLPQIGGDIVLTKINQDGYASEYLFRDTTVEYRAKIRHTAVPARGSVTAKDRHNFEVVKKTYGVAPAPDVEQKFYFVMEAPASVTSVALADAVADLMILTSNAFLVSLTKWES